MPRIKHAHKLASGAGTGDLLGAAAGTGFVRASSKSSSSAISAFLHLPAAGLGGKGLAVPVGLLDPFQGSSKPKYLTLKSTIYHDVIVAKPHYIVPST